MITQLSIQGLAIIDTLEIDFAPGFNVITGETGAGKSILIRALNFLTGGKTSPDVVRSGWQAATVSGEFVVPRAHPAVGQLESLGIAMEEGASVTLLLRRQVQAKGRSQAWVNDTPVALPSLRAVGQTLLDVFAQHENQRLLNAGDHVDYVDSFLDSPRWRDQVRVLGRRCAERIADLTALLESAQDKQRQSDYLSFRHDELRKFEPSKEDFESIENYCRQAEGFRKHRDPVAQAVALLEGGDGEAPSKTVQQAGKLLSGVGEGQSLRDRVLACARELDDVGFELGKILSSMEFDEQRLEECQERLFGYQDLFRKHSVRDIESLMAQAQSIAAELAGLNTLSERLEEEVTALQAEAGKLKTACAELSTARLQAAATIKEDVELELADLHMRGSVFQAQFTSIERTLPDLGPAADPALQARWAKLRGILSGLSEQGAEKAQFFLSANPGEPPLPLSRVASGGELSRIMLALKKALAADAETCVLVFDEIDSGISGRVADVMGRKMRELTKSFQVICISHLPQVAVYADSHFLVTKKGKGDRTQSSIVPLTKDESAEEIARLLSGRDVSATSLANAKALIASARAAKKKTGSPSKSL